MPSDLTPGQREATLATMHTAFWECESGRSVIERILDALLAAGWRREPQPAEPFQARVQPWMTACFGATIAGDRVERGDRLLEEVFELLQSGGYDQERVMALCGYVWSREVGEPAQEVGGVMVTLAAYCLAHGLDMHAAAETELARVWTKVEKIRAKQAAKPTGSALPQAWPHPDAISAAEARGRREGIEAAIADVRDAIPKPPTQGWSDYDTTKAGVVGVILLRLLALSSKESR